MFELAYNRERLHRELHSYLAKNNNMTGVKVLSILIREPGTPMDVIELTLRLEYTTPNIEPLVALLGSAFPDVPASDHKAICQYRQRIKQLIEQKARRITEDENADCADLDWEIDWLTKELRTVTRPGGGIKKLNPDKKKALDRYRIAVKRLLEKAKVENPPVYELIRKSLVCGKAFIWKDI